jgi:hypothetical protein
MQGKQLKKPQLLSPVQNKPTHLQPCQKNTRAYQFTYKFWMQAQQSGNGQPGEPITYARKKSNEIM